MRFLSNFGGKIIFMCSVNFWRQEDSGNKSLLAGSQVHNFSVLTILVLYLKWKWKAGTP